MDAACILDNELNKNTLTQEQDLKWDAYAPEKLLDAHYISRIRGSNHDWDNKIIELLLKIVRVCKGGDLILFGEKPPSSFKSEIPSYYIQDNGYTFDYKFNFIQNESSIYRKSVPQFKNICLEKKPFMKWMKKTLSSVIHEQD